MGCGARCRAPGAYYSLPPTFPGTVVKWLLWRGSKLALGREAAPENGTAAQSNGSELPRHR
ncbi:hypothetical protein PflCFBP13510_16435 [Pseudomonas fluorescens]|nr:hypothetical protein PflCFBP13510_16435 [Pseudomonas fluorescens]